MHPSCYPQNNIVGGHLDRLLGACETLGGSGVGAVADVAIHIEEDGPRRGTQIVRVDRWRGREEGLEHGQRVAVENYAGVVDGGGSTREFKKMVMMMRVREEETASAAYMMQCGCSPLQLI